MNERARKPLFFISIFVVFFSVSAKADLLELDYAPSESDLIKITLNGDVTENAINNISNGAIYLDGEVLNGFPLVSELVNDPREGWFSQNSDIFSVSHLNIFFDRYKYGTSIYGTNFFFKYAFENEFIQQSGILDTKSIRNAVNIKFNSNPFTNKNSLDLDTWKVTNLSNFSNQDNNPPPPFTPGVPEPNLFSLFLCGLIFIGLFIQLKKV